MGQTRRGPLPALFQGGMSETFAIADPRRPRQCRSTTAGVALRLAAFLAIATLASAADPQFSTFFGGSQGEFAAGVATDPAGNIYIAGQTGSPDLPVTADAAQPRYAGGSDAFVAKYSSAGALLWATYYGGSGGDGARGIAVDPHGNVLVAGITGSLDLPVVNALSAHMDGGHLRYGTDAFVLKLDTDGRIVYATYLGGNCNDWAWAIAADAQGNAYVTGDTCSADFPSPSGTAFPVPTLTQGSFVAKLDPSGVLLYSKFLDNTTPRGIAVDSSGAAYITGAGSPAGSTLLSGQARIFVAKVAPDGASISYASTFGGSLTDYALGIAVDSSGAAYLAGVTSSADFPLVHSLQSSLGSRTLWKTVDDGATWFVIEDSPLGSIATFVPDPKTFGTAYAGTADGGVFKTIDGGTTWNSASAGLPIPAVATLAIDPANPSVLYASAASSYFRPALRGLYRSVDAAATWQLIDSQSPTTILVDGNAPGVVYTFGDGAIRKSTDGGDSWTILQTPAGISGVALDPNAPGVLFAPYYLFFGIWAGSEYGVYRSQDGGATWNKATGVGYSNAILVDASHKPSIVYAGTSARSDDGGLTWVPIHGIDGMNLLPTSIDTATGAVIAIPQRMQTGLYLSTDRGLTWQPAPNSPVSGPAYQVPGIAAIVPAPQAPGTEFAVVTQTQTSAFVTKLSPDGTQLLFSTYLHGHPSVDPAQNIDNAAAGGLMPPSSPTGSNYATGIALDPHGNIAIAGATRSTDFFVVNPWQSTTAGQYDAFAALISADTNWLYNASYYGGALNDQARGIAVDAQGNLILAGQTHSGEFPVSNAAQPAKSLGDDAYVLKIAPQLPPGVGR